MQFHKDRARLSNGGSALIGHTVPIPLALFPVQAFRFWKHLRSANGKRMWASLVYLTLTALAIVSVPAPLSAQNREDIAAFQAGGYTRHHKWGIFLGTGATDAERVELQELIRTGQYVNPFTGEPFDDAEVFVFGLENPVAEGVRVGAAHLDVPVLSSRKGVRDLHVDFAICHSNGCTETLSAQAEGIMRADNVLALGADWSTRDFRPGELRGADVTFFEVRSDLIPRLPAPSWELVNERTPGLVLRKRFGPGDSDGYNVVRLERPQAATNPLRAHYFLSSYSPAIQAWMQGGGNIQTKLRSQIAAAGTFTPPKPGTPEHAGWRETQDRIAAEIGVGGAKFKPPTPGTAEYAGWQANQAKIADEIFRRGTQFKPPEPGTPEYAAWQANQAKIAGELKANGSSKRLGEEIAKTEAAMNAFLANKATREATAAAAERERELERERKQAEAEQRAADPSRPSTFDQVMSALQAASMIYQSVQSMKGAKDTSQPNGSAVAAPQGMCLNQAAVAANEQWNRDFAAWMNGNRNVDPRATIRTPDGKYIPWFVPCQTQKK